MNLSTLTWDGITFPSLELMLRHMRYRRADLANATATLYLLAQRHPTAKNAQAMFEQNIAEVAQLSDWINEIFPLTDSERAIAAEVEELEAEAQRGIN